MHIGGAAMKSEVSKVTVKQSKKNQKLRGACLVVGSVAGYLIGSKLGLAGGFLGRKIAINCRWLGTGVGLYGGKKTGEYLDNGGETEIVVEYNTDETTG
jgi:hypothetical protein